MDIKELGKIIYNRHQTHDMKLFERYANCIIGSNEFKFFMETGYPNRLPILKK
jgi:hypothetical protein